MQEEFKTKLGILVDFPKMSGSGTSNDGNTSRRAFEKKEIFSCITGVDLEPIKRIHKILLLINSFLNKIYLKIIYIVCKPLIYTQVILLDHDLVKIFLSKDPGKIFINPCQKSFLNF